MIYVFADNPGTAQAIYGLFVDYAKKELFQGAKTPFLDNFEVLSKKTNLEHFVKIKLHIRDAIVIDSLLNVAHLPGFLTEVAKKQNDGVIVWVHNPRTVWDSSKEQDREMMRQMAAIAKSQLPVRPAVEKIPVEIIKKIEVMRSEGHSFAHIARVLSVSKQSAKKYGNNVVIKSPFTDKHAVEKEKKEVRKKYPREMQGFEGVGANLLVKLQAYFLTHTTNTRINVSSDWRSVIKFIAKSYGRPQNVGFLTEDKFIAYVREMQKNDLQPATIIRRMVSVRGFFKYLLAKKEIAIDPTAMVRLPKVSKYEIKRVLPTKEEVQAIYKYFESRAKDDLPPLKKMRSDRNFMMVKLMLYTGMRVNSAVGIRMKDFEIKGKNLIVRVNRKGADDKQTIKLSEDLSKDLAIYIRRWVPGGEGSDYIFYPGERGKAIQEYSLLNVRTFHSIFTQCCKKVGARKGITTHSLRVFFATEMHKSGFALEKIQKALGHSSPSQTMAYIKIADEALKTDWMDQLIGAQPAADKEAEMDKGTASLGELETVLGGHL